MSEEFAKWLIKELDQRGWSQSEAARRGNISSSMFSKVITGYASPGLDFCEGVARAFDIPLEDILRLAGILPAKRRARRVHAVNAPRVIYELENAESQELVEEMVDRFLKLAPADQELVIALLDRLSEVRPVRIVGEPGEGEGRE